MINGRIGLRPVCKKGVDGKSLGELSGARPLRITQAPEAGYRAGYFYLPLGWICPITFKPALCAE